MLTIPKLELRGTVLASRLCKRALEEGRMQFSAVNLFVNLSSSRVGFEIVTGKRSRFFGSNVKEVLENGPQAQWNYILVGEHRRTAFSWVENIPVAGHLD